MAPRRLLAPIPLVPLSLVFSVQFHFLLILPFAAADDSVKKAPTKRRDQASAKSTSKKIRIMTNVQDLHPAGGFPSIDDEQPTIQVPVHDKLQVVPRPDTIKLENYLTEESAAYYASLGFDKEFALKSIPSWIYAPGPFSPVPLHEIEIDSLFDAQDNFQHVAMVELLYPMVHPNCSEVINGVVHTFVNLAIIPDFILDDDTCLTLLGLKI